MSGWLRAKRGKKSTIASSVSLRRCLLYFHEQYYPVPSARPFVPPTLRLAIESVLGRSSNSRRSPGASTCLARRQAPRGRTWRLGDRRSGLPFTFRTPPAPYREAEHALGPGFAACAGNLSTAWLAR